MQSNPKINADFDSWVREVHDALIYTGSKWRPWLWWSTTGAAAGAIGGVTSSGVLGNFMWGILLLPILFIAATKLYRLLEREYTAKSIQRTFFFLTAFCLAFVIALPALSDRYGVVLRVVVVSLAGLLGGLNAILLSSRVRRFNLWLVSGITFGMAAAVTGLLVFRLATATVPDLQTNAVAGAVVGLTYCALLGGAFVWVFWDASCIIAQLAHQWEAEERIPEAIAMYDLAISIRPDDPLFYYNRGTYHTRLGQYEQAFTDFDKAISLNPNDAPAYSNRGSAYLEIGDFASALADYENALSIDPNDSVTLNSRGNLHAELGDSAAALADFDRSIEIAPTDAMAYSNRGAVNSKLGNVPRAIEDYGLAIEHAPEYANSYANRAFAYYKLGEYKRGLADCDEALRLRPDHAASYSNRGLCRAALGDAEGAAQDFRRALELPCPPAVREEAVSGLRALGLNAEYQ